jgi:hypothetical protein
MPKYIKPFEVPRRVPQVSDPGITEPRFRMDDSELAMFDHYTKESIDAAGTDCELFTLSLTKSKIDPLYSEPSKRVFDGPFLMTVFVEWPEGTPEAGEEGMSEVWPSGCWIPRKTLEEVACRSPREGDVIRFWKIPYFDKDSVRAIEVPVSGYFFDVIQVNDDGHLFDQKSFVAFRCNLKRRTTFTSERLLTNT